MTAIYHLSINAATLVAKVENMSFYAALGDDIRSIPKEEKLIALGEFNAKVGKRHETSGLSVPMALEK